MPGKVIYVTFTGHDWYLNMLSIIKGKTIVCANVTCFIRNIKHTGHGFEKGSYFIVGFNMPN